MDWAEKIHKVEQKGVEWFEVVEYKIIHGHPPVQQQDEQVSYRLGGLPEAKKRREHTQAAEKMGPQKGRAA